METIVKDAFNPEQFVPLVSEATVAKRESLNRILIGAAAFAVMLIVVGVIHKSIEEKKRDQLFPFV